MVVSVYDGFHARSAAIGGGVHVGTKADDGDLPGAIARDGGIYVSGVVHVRVPDAHLPQFLYQQPAQVLLFGSGRDGCGGGIRLGVQADITKKTVYDGMLERY
jgi:hypothetical protein